MHLLRCSPCCSHPLLKELDNFQRSNICHIANVDLCDVQWIQAIGSHYNQYAIDWSTTFSCSLPSELESHKQRTWDKPNVTTDVNYIFQSSQDTQARLASVSAAHSNDWLNALPIASYGLRLDNEDIRVAIGLRLGTALYQPHLCPCGAIVEEDGLHGLSFKLGNLYHIETGNLISQRPSWHMHNI